jgi:hypothetical protein
LTQRERGQNSQHARQVKPSFLRKRSYIGSFGEICKQKRTSQVLLYLDSFIIGLTATPAGKTIGFFNQNLGPTKPSRVASTSISTCTAFTRPRRYGLLTDSPADCGRYIAYDVEKWAKVVNF